MKSDLESEVSIEIAFLKEQLEFIELIEGQSDLLLEHLVKKFVNVKVKMYQENHGIPHVHLDVGNENHSASISIIGQDILAGSVEKKYKKTILAWIKKNETKLIDLWNTMQEGETIDLPKIA